MMLPMLIGLTMILIRVNTVIQMSIVNQQYSRAQTHWLAFNSAIYPERKFRDKFFVDQGYNQMVLGVSDNAAPSSTADTYAPEASKFMVARSKKFARGPDDATSEANEKAIVRVRNTVTMCTQSNVFNGGGGFKNINLMKEGVTPASFSYCRGPTDE